MKKLFIYLLLIMAMAVNASAALDNGVGNVVKPTSYWFHGDPIKDQGLLWMKEVETLLEAWTLDGSNDTITFANGLAIDNAADNIFEWNENSDELKWTFGSNKVALSSTDVLEFSIGTIYLGMTEISAPSGNPSADNGWLYLKDDAATTKLYFEDSAGTVTDILASASGNTLNAAYDQGGAGAGRTITADTGAFALTNTDADTAFLMTINAAPGSAAALGGIEITVGGNSTENGIEIENTGSGDDIQGTGDTWAVDKAGVGTFSSIVTSLIASTGTTTLGDGTGTVAINSSSWDITTAGAVSGLTTLGMSGDLTISAGDVILANGKVVKGSVTNAETVGVSAYDVDGAGYVATFTLTNGNTIAAVLGTGVETVAINSTVWDITTAGVVSGLTGLTTAGGAVNINVSANFATNINTGTSTGTVTIGGAAAQTINIGDGAAAKTVTLGSSNSTSTTTLLSGSGGLNLNASNNQPTNINTGNSTGATTIGNALSDISFVGHIQGASPLILDGATDNGFETTVAVTDPTADITWTFPDGGADTLAFMGSTLATNYPEVANSVTGGTNQLIFEGSDADTEETIITATDPTADIIWTLADGGAQTVAFVPSTLATNFVDIVNSVWMGTNQLIFEGTDADTEETVITVTDATADNTFTFADDSGLVAYTADGGKTTLSGAGAIPLTDAIVEWTTTGANAGSLADGKPGQILTVVIVTDGGEGTIAPDTTATGWATVVLTDDIDTVTFFFADTTSGWVIMGTAAAAGNAVAVTQ